MEMICFKKPEDAKDYRFLDERLAYIVAYIEEVVWALEKEPVTVTRIYEKDGSTHQQSRPYRFIDLGMFTRINNDWLREVINERFPYGAKIKGKPGMTVVPFDHGTAKHYHLQVRRLQKSSGSRVVA